MPEPVLQDYLNASSVPIKNLTIFVKTQLDELCYTLQHPVKKQMSIIQEQQNQRQGQDQDSYQMRKQFNRQIIQLKQILTNFQQITQYYKIELQNIAKEMVQHQKQFQKLKKQNKQLKNQIQVSRRKAKTFYEENQEQQKVRQAPSPLKEASLLEVSRKASLQRERASWKALSHKIDQCKKKIEAYQHQAKLKDDQIVSLKNQLSKKDKQGKQQQEKKKLKKDNTTLRGEKVLLNNQISSLRKQIAQKTQLNSVLEIQIKKLRLQLQNSNSSLNWHINNINQVRNSHYRQEQYQQRQSSQKISDLVRANKTMMKCLQEQQDILIKMQQKVKKVQQKWQRLNEQHKKKVNQFQGMLDDKNQTILRLKTEIRSSDKNGYHVDMVRVLNKKLAEKQEKIRQLQEIIHDSAQ